MLAHRAVAYSIHMTENFNFIPPVCAKRLAGTTKAPPSSHVFKLPASVQTFVETTTTTETFLGERIMRDDVGWVVVVVVVVVVAPTASGTSEQTRVLCSLYIPPEIHANVHCDVPAAPM
ncbi:hypothetical protein QTP88_022742 [Uroleucon formosanum]